MSYTVWPLEATLSRPALAHVQLAIKQFLERDAPRIESPIRAELQNMANSIRACLQHEPLDVEEYTLSNSGPPSDPLLA